VFDPNTSIFAGMTPAQLQAAIASAQAAYIELMSGQKVASLSYAQGDGAKTITYEKTNIAALQMFIKQLQMQLGVPVSRRRAVGFRFV
jgi:gpW